MTYYSYCPARHNRSENDQGNADIGFSENAMVKEQDGKFGNTEDYRVENLAHEEADKEVLEAFLAVELYMSSDSSMNP